MSIDMTQFHQVFFEESFEGLEVMESGLMELEPGAADSEAINSVFRAAHSIKGGSGTFGFKAIADFTHVMETLLDEMRDGIREVTRHNSDILLRSVDCLREMLEATQAGNEVEKSRVQEFQQLLDQELASGQAKTGTSQGQKPEPETSGAGNRSKGWAISFVPERRLFQTGNDPLAIIRELGELGELEVEVDLTQVPVFELLESEECFMSWSFKLYGDVGREQIDELFAWVEDICDLKIKAIESKSSDLVVSKVASSSSPSESISSSMPLPQRRASDDDPEAKFDRRAGDRRGSQSGSSSIRVDTVKIDSLINMVGELVITQSMLGLLGETIEENQQITPQEIEKLRNGLMQLERNTRELQENVMQVRMMPISFTFSRFPRLVRDLSGQLGKKIELKLSGETTEVDKNIIEKISDPLVHLVRNSLDHGIEMPEQRIASGKDETGTILLDAYHGGGNIVIDIADDGKGMDRDVLFRKGVEKGLINEDDVLSDKQVFDLIFMAGFSTAAEITDVSGRGVGMDVVRRNIHELGGSVEIASTLGQGSKVTIRLPLTLAILDGQTIRVGDEHYIVPITSIVESLQLKSEMVNMVSGQGETFKLRDEYIPIIRLHNIFGVETKYGSLEEGLIVVVESGGQRMGLLIDELLGQQQVVIKSLEQNYRKTEGFSGATILGDGSVALILDMPGITRLNKNVTKTSHVRAA
ncbi:MAG: chemotaxis protein CheA [Gammaproteobacteria bacterium]|nr:chemotaxis protein CheA [Gammaproteobacteria bacterium]